MNILIGLLLIAVIIFLLALVKVFLNLANTIKKVEDVITDNKRNIDISILEVSRNLEETTKLLKTINLKERELRETMDNVQVITEDISKMTTAAANTLEKSEEIISATTEAVKGFNKINKIFNKEN